MNTGIKMGIKNVQNWLDHHPKAKEWLWFVALWCGGLFTVTSISYPIRWLIKKMG